MHPRPSTILAALQEHGWIEMSDIHLPGDMLSLAKHFGQVVNQESRPPISMLKPILTEAAASATASKTYGTGEFPFHTDLAHWPTPARFVVMGNFDVVSRTPTLLLDTRTDDVFRALRPLAKRAIWKVAKTRRAFNCTMLFTHGDTEGLRWDTNVMSPTNPAAEELAQRLENELPLSGRSNLQSIQWHQTGRALIVDNWRMLHARPSVPTTDLMRTLHRVFVTGE